VWLPARLLGILLASSALGVSQRACPAASDREGSDQSETIQTREPLVVEQTGTMPPSVRESSGVVASRVHRGVVWSHNDSGDGPILYALDLTGKLLRSFRLDGAAAEDWEDMASGACPPVFGTHGPCLFVADVGDNEERRATYQVYVVSEPDPGTGTGETRSVGGVRRLDFAYPDGSHDSESLAVTATGDLLVITKVRAGKTPVFRLTAAAVDRALGRDTLLVATLLDTLSIAPSFFLGRTATGAAISPSGTRMVVRTYTQLYFYTVTRDGHLTPDGAPCSVGGLALVGEAVDFVDDEMLVLTSESVVGHPGEIHTVRC